MYELPRRILERATTVVDALVARGRARQAPARAHRGGPRHRGRGVRAANVAPPVDKVIVRMLAGALGVLVLLAVFVPAKPLPDFLTDATLSRADAANGSAVGSSSQGYRLTHWREFVPPHWKPAVQLRTENIASLDDSDPRAKELLASLRSAWDEAPPNTALDGAAIRTAGFVVPIEQTRDGTREFLLVPYYGACIHTPPPPANQIIDVVASRPVKDLDTMDTVWVEGRLTVARNEHESGASVYALRADHVLPFDGAVH
jgi:uncharacterized protein